MTTSVALISNAHNTGFYSVRDAAEIPVVKLVISIFCNRGIKQNMATSVLRNAADTLFVFVNNA